MTSLDAPRAFQFALFILAACALVFLVRFYKSWRRIEPPDPELALWIRLMWRPATILELLLGPWIPQRLARDAAHELTAVDLGDVLPASRWLCLRVMMGLTVALLASAVPVLAVLAALVAFFYGGAWLAALRREREAEMLRELPAFIDLLTINIEAGVSLTAGMRLVVERAPRGTLRSYFVRVLGEIRSGRARADAFTVVAERYDMSGLTTLAAALAHSESSGMSLGAVLRAQSAQRTAERFSRAEKLAMQAPVKLLGPLILCIFPCTFIVIAIPMVARIRDLFGS
jgi:tight adherence protein C